MLLKCYSTGIRNDLDKANLVPGLSCPVLNSQGRNTAWFLTLNPHHWIVWTSNSWHSIKYSPKVTPEGHQLCAQERLILCVFDKLKIPKKHTKSDIPWYTPKLSHTKKNNSESDLPWIYHGFLLTPMDIPWIYPWVFFPTHLHLIFLRGPRDASVASLMWCSNSAKCFLSLTSSSWQKAHRLFYVYTVYLTLQKKWKYMR